MKDSDWEILYELYKLPNITKVANKLYISQPSLSKRIQIIEENFKIQILTRTSKGIEFTEAGNMLALKAEQYMKFIKEVNSEISDLKNNENNVINIACSYTYNKQYLPQILSNYLKDNPSVNFAVVTDESSALFKKVCDKEVDVGFVRGTYHANIYQKKICTTKAYLVTKRHFSREKLLHLRKIEYKCSDKTKITLDNWIDNNLNNNVPIINAGYVDVALEYVYNNLGYTCCFLDDNYLNIYNLVLTPLFDEDGEYITRHTWFIYNPAKKLSTCTKNFIDYIENDIINNDESNMHNF
ncbi:hypothetical protein AN396_02795 [Candidatus Epulonipiscium fishelsonii]|uniref:Uncharacterized protein n=1 Tax=Candidatus Epulonipiscium fishelsonii TaxID=77094 RepID=A0ACC8XFH8_9FIRM|nr:hypothetical protein AN396_02795 [Epulopiscium sp. SCG-B11WGA-EpuloA1]